MLTSVFHLNLDLKAIRTGVENAALLRVRMFVGLGIESQYLTVNYHPYFGELRESMLRLQMISPRLRFRNLYDHFQEAESGNSKSSNALPSLAGWNAVPVPDTSDWRLLDRSQRIVMYRKTSRTTGRLEYITYFHDKKLWRRDSFDTSGWLSRVQLLDGQGQAHYESYFRPDGSLALLQWYRVAQGRHSLCKIQVMDRHGFCTHEFSRKEELITLWLRQLTSDAQRQYVMIVDRNRLYYESLQELRRAAGYRGNISIISMVHAVHTRNGFDVERSTTNSIYAPVLENMASVDRIIVLTERQKRDILARYGEGKVDVIPHAFESKNSLRPESRGDFRWAGSGDETGSVVPRAI